jgi:hypothetical protein
MGNETPTMLLPILIGSFGVALIVTVLWCFDRRSKTILQKWTDADGFRLLEKKKQYLSTGPFKWWTNGRNQIIYFFKVRDREGRERLGWARCGSYLGGVFFSNQIEIRWE